MKPKALVLTGNGLNCDYESHHILQNLAGMPTDMVHLNLFYGKKIKLGKYGLLFLIGGFESGDEGGSAVMWAHNLRKYASAELTKFVNDGKLVLGSCNGFQALAKYGLLPGLDGDYLTRTMSVIYNDSGNFRDQWVTLKANPDSPCIFTKGIDYVDYGVRHGEGKVVFKDKSVLERIVANNQVPLQYCRLRGRELADGEFPGNPNGSQYDIAGVCDPTGRIFGLMPHPEAYNHPTNHPLWTRQKYFGRDLKAEGVKIFRNAVEYLEKL